MNYINGIIPPMVTPLLDEDTLDLDGLDKLINHLIEGGVDGLFILGTTGEGPSLNYSLRNELIKRVCKHVDNRVPVLVGITDSSYRESVNIANKSQELGAQAVVIAPPYYFNINQSELNNYFNKLIDMFPNLYVNLYKAAKNKDVKSALRLHNEIMKISSVIYSGSDYGSSNVINGIKYVLHCLGICSDYIAKPMKKISAEKATIIKKFIEENHLIVNKGIALNIPFN